MAEHTFNWKKCLDYAALSDVGMRRGNNQDSYTTVLSSSVEDWYERGHLFMVADGMGAHAAGELASKLATDGVPHLYFKHREQSPPEALKASVQETNTEVHGRGEANPEFHNMGTTASVMVLLPQGALLAHVGDSRVYRLRGKRLEQLTFDHSLQWEMKAAAEANNQEVGDSIPKNVITRSLGPNSTLKVDLEGPYPLEVGDAFLLCSDGLTGLVEDEELAAILQTMSAKEAAQVLVDIANLRGGNDNITVIVVKIIGPQITTKSAGADPLRVGDSQAEGNVPLSTWILLGVCALASLVMIMGDLLLPALFAGSGALLMAIVALLQRFGGFGGGGVDLTEGRRFGKGPYTKTDCPSGKELAESLKSLAGELDEVVAKQTYDIDWTQVRTLCDQAESHFAGGKHLDAVRDYARAISVYMRQIRRQRDKKPNDSSIGL